MKMDDHPLSILRKLMKAYDRSKKIIKTLNQK